MARRSLLTPQSPQKNQTSKNEWVDKETYFVLLSVVKITTLDWGVPCVWLVRRWEITGFTHRLIFTLFIWWGSFSRHRYFSAKHVTFTCSLELASFLFNPLLHQRGTSLCSGPAAWWVQLPTIDGCDVPTLKYEREWNATSSRGHRCKFPGLDWKVV